MASLLSSNVIVTGLGFVGGILIARFASVEERGTLGEVLIWVTLVTGVFLAGHLEYYLSRRTPSRFPFGRHQVAMLCVLTISVLALVLSFDGHAEHLWYAFLFVPLNVYSSIRIAQITLLGRVHALSIYKIVQPLAYIFGLTLLWALNYLSVEGLLIANAVSNLVLCMGIKFWGGRGSELHAPDEVEWERWRVISLSSVIGFFASQFDRVSVSLLFSNSDVAHYLVGLTIIGAPLSVIGQATATLLLSKLVGDIDLRLVRHLSLIFKLAVALVIAAALMVVLAPFIISVLLGEKYLPIVEVSVAVAAVGVVSNFRVVLIRLMRILGRSWAVLCAEIFFVLLVSSMTIISHALNIRMVEFLYLYAASGICGLVVLFILGHVESQSREP